MTKPEMKKLFDLLTAYFPGAKQVKANLENTKLAWGIALEPYRWDNVRWAVVSYAISNKFFPDLADITALCPEMPIKKQADRRMQADIDALFAEDKKP